MTANERGTRGGLSRTGTRLTEGKAEAQWGAVPRGRRWSGEHDTARPWGPALSSPTPEGRPLKPTAQGPAVPAADGQAQPVRLARSARTARPDEGHAQAAPTTSAWGGVRAGEHPAVHGDSRLHRH